MVQYAKEAFGENPNLSVGMQLVLDTEYGEQVVTIAKMDNDNVWLDTNHPLAGVTLHFNGAIESVEEMTEEMLAEMKAEHEHGGCGGHDCCGQHEHGGCGSEDDEEEHGHHHGDGGCCGSHKKK
jgi:FKBP-type peptidyl-prolyl cis-trans isomerase SlyD